MTEPYASPRGSAIAPVRAGVVTALVAYTSSFAVVLQGLRAVGATESEAASGLAALAFAMGAGSIALAVAYRRPITMAWSTPGAALLVTTALPHGGFAAATGSFVAAGILFAATGAIRPLARAVRLIPGGIANAMLAGVLLQICTAPFTGLADNFLGVGTVVLVWLVMWRWMPRWAVPGAFITALIQMWADGAFALIAPRDLMPALQWVTPHVSGEALLSIALPLYVVTMTSQNIPGISVMSSLGWNVPFAPAMLVGGAGTVLGAPFGGHAVNLSAIAAALDAGDEAGEDRSRRWIAAVTTGGSYVALGVFAPVVVLIASRAQQSVLPTIAGLALLGTLGSAMKSALLGGDDPLPGIVTFSCAASGLSVGGIGSAFWALLAGILVHSLARARVPWRLRCVARQDTTPDDSSGVISAK